LHLVGHFRVLYHDARKHEYQVCDHNIDHFSSVSHTILSTVCKRFTANRLALKVGKMNRTKFITNDFPQHPLRYWP